MKLDPLLKFVVLCGTLALAGCKPDPLGPTGVQLDLLTTDSRLYASYFVLAWMDEQAPLFEVRVPEGDAFIDAEQAPAVSVFIALDTNKVGKRRVLARGYGSDGQLVSEGAATLRSAAGVWVQLGVSMSPFGSLPDQDGDGLPDAVDNCPHERDPCGSGQVVADGGPEPLDAVSPSFTDVGADLPTEREPNLPTGLTDASPDLPRH